MHDVDYWVRTLELLPHPEGGFYRETYRSDEQLSADQLPARFGGSRAMATAIYFLLDRTHFSALHRIKSDELWSFYAGTGMTVHIIAPDGTYSELRLGNRVDAGEVFQGVVKAGCWFGATVNDPASFALVGCMVAPAFDFRDFELADRATLTSQFPAHRALIERLTRS